MARSPALLTFGLVPTYLNGVTGRLRLGEGVDFSGYRGGLGRAHRLEDIVRLPQAGLRLGGPARGCSAPAQAGQRVRLIPGAVCLAGQLQRLLVARPGPARVAEGKAQRPSSFSASASPPLSPVSRQRPSASSRNAAAPR